MGFFFRFGPERIVIGLKVSIDLLRITLRRLNAKLVTNATRIFLSFLARFDSMQSEASHPIEVFTKYSISLNDISSETIGWLSKYESDTFPTIHIYTLLEVLNICIIYQ